MKVKGRGLAISLAAIVALCGLAACARDRGVEAARDGRPTVSPAEQDFMMKATQAHLAEIDMAKMALQKTDNTDVKDYAHMIQSDHNSALANLSDLMKDKNVPEPQAVSADAQQEISRMNNLTGPEFDREFVNMMVSDHQKAVGLFRDQQAIAQNSDVKDYVDNLLPKLEMHLDKAMQLQSQLFSQPATH